MLYELHRNIASESGRSPSKFEEGRKRMLETFRLSSGSGPVGSVQRKGVFAIRLFAFAVFASPARRTSVRPADHDVRGRRSGIRLVKDAL